MNLNSNELDYLKKPMEDVTVGVLICVTIMIEITERKYKEHIQDLHGSIICLYL